MQPVPTGGTYSAPPDALAGFEGAASRQGSGGEGRAGKKEGKGRRWRDTEMKGWGREEGKEGERGRERWEEGKSMVPSIFYILQ